MSEAGPTWKGRIADGLIDAAILAVTPFARLFFRVGEKAKEKGWV